MAAFPNAFSALFRSGSLTHEVDLGMQLEELILQDKIFFAQGFRLRFIYRFTGDGSYQVAWEKGSGAQFWLTTNDLDEFKSEDSKHFNNGLRLKYLHVEDGHFIGIWQEGSGGQHWLANVSFDEFKQKDEELKNQGFMLMKMNDDGGKYSGYWQPRNKKYSWISISASSTDQFNEFVHTNAEKGRLAVSFGGDQLCAVFHEESGEQRWALFLEEKAFKQRCEELFKEHFHIVDLFMTV
ncbi:MAG: hypothetical protein ACR2FN_09140 [Chitinophagaceae bacterium]